MSDSKLVSVFSVGNPIEAEIIKSMLAGEGIDCFIDNEHQAALAGLDAIEIHLLVPEASAEEATRLIQSHQHSGPRADENGDEDNDDDENGSDSDD